MNVNVKFEGVTDAIIQDAIKKGLAKTRTEVLRLGLFELKNKYHLAEEEPTAGEKKHLAEFLHALRQNDFGSEKE